MRASHFIDSSFSFPLSPLESSISSYSARLAQSSGSLPSHPSILPHQIQSDCAHDDTPSRRIFPGSLISLRASSTAPVLVNIITGSHGGPQLGRLVRLTTTEGERPLHRPVSYRCRNRQRQLCPGLFWQASGWSFLQARSCSSLERSQYAPL